MVNALLQLLLFSTKAIIIVVLILLLLAGVLALLGRGKEKFHGKIRTKNLNKKYAETTETLLEDILSKKQFKHFLKEKKATEKLQKHANEMATQKNMFVIHFDGDIKASAVASLREEVTAVLGIAKPTDEVIVCIDSGGGMVHTYGLAAAQLQRIRQQQIPLTVIVDKVAASGGYLMASIANKILAAPFAIIGSIGVIVQLPNFHRLLKEHHIDFEQLTAGNFKRTLTLFGNNTPEAREKLQEEIEEVQHLFKNLILQYRPDININEVATGEHWLGQQALGLNLVDALTTSDDYFLTNSKTANLFEIKYELKKSFASKLASTVSLLTQSFLEKEPTIRM